MLLGENGIIKTAELKKVETRGASVEEARDLWFVEIELAKTTGGTVKDMNTILNELKEQKLLTAEEVEIIKNSENNEITIGRRTISFNTDYKPEIKTNKPNTPLLLTGMSPIKFTDPIDTAKGTVVETNSKDSEWYNYEAKKWANAKTQDGSMWVWIPRYAYKITYYTDETKQTISEEKTSYGKIDAVFLNGKTDTYYDEEGKTQTAKRAKSADEIVDTTEGYTVHPAFTNESSINYANGGWDEELTGLWVAKFEAGYASGNNNVTPKDSSGAIHKEMLT